MNLEEKYGLKNNEAIILLVIGVAFFISFVLSIGEMFIPNTPNGTKIMNAINLICLLGLIYYAVFAYKKPHGNVMKYLFILFAINRGCLLIIMNDFGTNAVVYPTVISTILVSYIAGRLNKINENKVLAIIVSLALIVESIYAFSMYMSSGYSIVLAFCSFTPLIIWVALFAAYQLRYKQHKDAAF